MKYNNWLITKVDQYVDWGTRGREEWDLNSNIDGEPLVFVLIRRLSRGMLAGYKGSLPILEKGSRGEENDVEYALVSFCRELASQYISVTVLK